MPHTHTHTCPKQLLLLQLVSSGAPAVCTVGGDRGSLPFVFESRAIARAADRDKRAAGIEKQTPEEVESCEKLCPLVGRDVASGSHFAHTFGHGVFFVWAGHPNHYSSSLCGVLDVNAPARTHYKKFQRNCLHDTSYIAPIDCTSRWGKTF